MTLCVSGDVPTGAVCVRSPGALQLSALSGNTSPLRVPWLFWAHLMVLGFRLHLLFQGYLPLMLLIRDEAIRGKSWFSRFSANSPSIFAKPTDYDT